MMNQKKPKSVVHYTNILALVLLILFMVTVYLITHRMTLVQASIQQKNAEVALAELKSSFKKIEQVLVEHAKQFSHWDEVRQQLITPVYYQHWLDNRALSAKKLPNYIKKIELYNSHGIALSETVQVPFPKSAPKQQRMTLVNDSHKPGFIVFYSINDPMTKAKLGYVSLMADFKGTLLINHQFSKIDIHSLKINALHNQVIKIDALPELIKYEFINNPEANAIKVIMMDGLSYIALIIIAFLMVVYILLHSVLVSPLKRLAAHLEVLGEGEHVMLASSFSGHLQVQELDKVRCSLNEYQNKIDQLINDVEQKNDELWILTHRDSLTGVNNRRGFEDALTKIMEIGKRRQMMIVLMIFDCDHFKMINDSYGHDIGDKVVQNMALILQQAIPFGEHLYRLSGDEFAVIFLDKELEKIGHIAKNCKQAFEAIDFAHIGINEPVTISIGITSGHDTQQLKVSELYREADIAIYQAKKPGNDKIQVYSDQHTKTARIIYSNRFASLVFNAIESGEHFEMHYQLVRHHTDKNKHYFEALVRLRDEFELILPGTIFPIVERWRLEKEFDQAVLKAVYQDLQSGLIPEGYGISINLSAASVMSDDLRQICQPFEAYVSSRKILLEVTETALINQMEQVTEKLSKLREIGFEIALDDFGSSYCSLHYLANMPVDYVKFDISMIRSLEKGGPQSMIVESLVGMIKTAGYGLIAEGIELETTKNLIYEIGFDYAQGYYFSKPIRQLSQFKAARNNY